MKLSKRFMHTPAKTLYILVADLFDTSPNENLAEKLAKMGMPGFGCTPDRLPELLATVLKGNDLRKFAEQARLS